jgi:hypothetical protein
MCGGPEMASLVQTVEVSSKDMNGFTLFWVMLGLETVFKIDE